MPSFADIIRPPDSLTVFAQNAEAVRVLAVPENSELRITVSAPDTGLSAIRLRWNGTNEKPLHVLGDEWERGYGTLEWRGIVPERILPWYFLTTERTQTHGYGVKTGAKAFCCWQIDQAGITLWLDMRNGGDAVHLGDRRVDAAIVVAIEGTEGISPFAAARDFCRALCPSPRLPKMPVYGGNNWYYAYGHSSHKEICADSQLIAAVAPDNGNRPWMVIDDGWQQNWDINPIVGPWNKGNSRFPDMAGLAQEMLELGVQPGIWIRPLVTTEPLPKHWFLGDNRFEFPFAGRVLDPTVPEAKAQITKDMGRLIRWGYHLIKHDFTTFDLLGRWGFQMGREMTAPGWHFADQSRTNAEIILELYQAIRDAAGDAIILGCNTVGHLGAGLFEIQRTGDDTSGRAWERTRKMGINTLAFRMPQQGAFFAVDADCVGLTSHIPWLLNKQWLDLLARSGTPLFVSAAPDAVGPEQREALKAAFARASQPQPVAEPLDWLETTCPRHWKAGSEEMTFDWFDSEGASPLCPS